MPELEPITREEMLLDGQDLEPITRKEMFIKRIYDKTQVIPEPITREEMFLKKAGDETTDVTIEQLNVSENGTYSEEGKAYSPVIVNVPAPPIPDNAYLLNEIEGLPKDIATFSDGSNLPMPSLKVGIEPQQDLHGYDSPWVGGSGKNLFNMGSKWSGSASGLSFTTDDDYVTMNGTKSGANYVTPSQLYFDLPAGTYYAKAFVISGTASSTPSVYVYSTQELTSNMLNTERNFTIESQTSVSIRFAFWNDGATYSNYKLGIVISKTANIDKFYPYSNICPISGHTEANVSVSPLNIASLYNGQIYGDGSWVSSNMRLTNVSSGQDNSYFLKAGTYTLDYDKLNSNAPSLLQCSALTKDDNYTIIDNFANEWNSVPFTFTLTQDGYFYFTIRKDADTNINPSDYKAKILGHTYTIQFKDGDNPLTVYGGSLDVVSGELVVVRAYVDLGSMTYGEYGSTSDCTQYYTTALDLLAKPNSQVISDIFVYGETITPWTMKITSGEQGRTYFRTTKDLYESPSAFKTAMNGHQLVYELATPITIQLTPTQVNSLLGSNNVWTDCGEVLEGQYFSKEE